MQRFWQENRALIITVLLAVALTLWARASMKPTRFVDLIFQGLTLGMLYFLVAAGLSIIFGLMDVLNFAHGSLFMIGAYAGWTFFVNPRLIFAALPPLLALTAGFLLAQPLEPRLRRLRLRQTPARLLTSLFILAALVAGFLALRNFPLQALAAIKGQTTGFVGDVDLSILPAAVGRQLTLLILAGWLAGLALVLNAAQRAEEARPRPLLKPLVLAAGLVVLAFALALGRDAAHEAVLALNGNLRFLLALVVGTGAGLISGALIEISLIRPLYERPIYQVLVTLGLVFVITEITRAIWGPTGYQMPKPDQFSQRCGSDNLALWFSEGCQRVTILGSTIPSYRLFIIGIGALLLAAGGIFLRRSRMGMIIRAGVQDPEMVQALGINVRRVFTLVFALGAGMAALGGVAAAPFLRVDPDMGFAFQLQAFIVVVIGGMGSYPGAALGALLLGLARAFGDYFVLSGIQLPWMDEAVRLSSSVARASTVLIMAVVLLTKPSGLFGKRE